MPGDLVDGARLRAWRKSLPGSAQGREISCGGISKALGWSESRWSKLEAESKLWTPHLREEVASGVRAIAARLDVPAETVEACVAHVLDGAPAPALGPWRDGQCPAPLMGRPKVVRRPRVLPRESGDDDPDPSSPQAARPVLPDSLRRTLVAATLRAVADGADPDEALVAILDLYEPLQRYYHEVLPESAA